VEDFQVKECKKCGFQVEEIDEGHYYCHCCEGDLSEDEVTSENLASDGHIKRVEDGSVEIKGFFKYFKILQ